MNLTSAVSPIQSLSCIITLEEVGGFFPSSAASAGGIACLTFNILPCLLDKFSISPAFVKLSKMEKILSEKKHLPTN